MIGEVLIPEGPHAVNIHLLLFIENHFFLISSPVENNCEWQLHYMWIFRTKKILLTLDDLFNDTEF